MFDKVTRNLLHQTDQDGTLIPVSRLNDSEKLKPLAVVIKCPGSRFWQRTKYKATDFTLNDLLQGKPIQPELNQRVFLNNYEETKKGDVTGSGEVEVVGVSMKAQAHGTSKVLSSLGKLLKESVIMQPFLEDSKDRKVDHQHSLIMQIQGKNQVLTFVKERIFTTCDCKINVSELKEGSCSALLKLLSPAKVHVYKSICLQNTRDVAIEIPPQTVMAYSVNELNIKADGHYEVCVSPDAVEADELTQQLFLNETEVDSFLSLTQLTDGSSLSALSKELSSVKATLCELARLPAETRFSLLNLFQEILPDQALLSILEDNLEKMCDESTYGSDTYLPETSNELTDSFMDLLQSETDSMETLPTGPNGALPSNQNRGQSANWKTANTRCYGSSVQSTNQRQLIMSAMHMLISVAEELTNDSLTLIKTFSSETIYGLNELVTLLTKSSQRVPFSELPFHLTDGGMPEEMELLFILSNITLKRDNKELYAEIGSGSKVLPVVLCIVIHGLAFLTESCETD